jgi:ABC-2 type transport system ATP-binding protein
MSFIEVSNLSKTFTTEVRHKGRFGAVKSLFSPQYNEVSAVKNINLSINSGESVAYLGPNGAGKSTTIKMLSGILVPTSGEVRIGDYIPYKQRKKNAYQIGAVFGQRSQLLFDLPLIDSFEYLRYMYSIPPDAFKKKLDKFAEILDIHELLKRPVRTLSLGQRMRGEIIAALLHDPEVVFLDEPTIGLDIIAKDRIRDFIYQINREENVTVILTTHDLGDVERLCPRLVIIDKGTIVYDGDLALIREKYATVRSITMTYRDASTAEAAARGTQKNRGLSIDLDGRKVSIGFDQLKIDSAELMRSLLSESTPIDLSIKDENIESIIKRIYAEGMREEVRI